MHLPGYPDASEPKIEVCAATFVGDGSVENAHRYVNSVALVQRERLTIHRTAIKQVAFAPKNSLPLWVEPEPHRGPDSPARR